METYALSSRENHETTSSEDPCWDPRKIEVISGGHISIILALDGMEGFGVLRRSNNASPSM